MREKILELKIDTTQVLKDNLDAVYLTEHDADQILTLLKEEIEKKGAIKSQWCQSGSRIKRFGAFTVQDALELYDKEGIMGVMEKASKVAAQAQLDKVLKILEPMEI